MKTVPHPHPHPLLLLLVAGWLASYVSGCLDVSAVVYNCTQRSALRSSLSSAATLAQYEEDYLKVPSAAKARAHLEYYASMPHVAGTKEDKHMAEWTREQMRSFGLETVDIHQMDALLSYPVSRSLRLVRRSGETVYRAKLEEDVVEGDDTSGSFWRKLSFNGYAPSGSVVARAVYANYGTPDDFIELERNRVNVSGMVVIARYGKCFRGLKAMNAQRRGAAAVLLYSDPQDDGYSVGPTYPDGPWRPKTSVQRGSVQFLSLCGGDPSRAWNKRSVEEICGYKQEELIPKIPVLPVSYGDIEPILKDMEGPVVSSGLRGALNITYRYGPTKNAVDLRVNNTFTTTPIWNVIAVIKGTQDSANDQPIVLGNHRDAWVFGAADPNSGSAVLLEVARGLGSLLTHTDWKPKRTIILCSWSAEEYGLVGSTGWAEEFASSLLKRAVVYLNVDVGVSGRRFKVAATPSLSTLIQKTLRKVRDPDSGKLLSEVWDGGVGTLGSGSDYTVFLDHLGITSLDMRFLPAESIQYGVYHSVYDSYHWVATQADPTFGYHKAMAQIWGLMALQLSTEEVLPLDHTHQAKALKQYLAHVKQLDPHELLQFAGLRRAIEKYERATTSVRTQIQNQGTCSAEINERLGFTERFFLHPKGLPQRKWYKHVLQSPGLYLGYAAEVFPGITQAINDHNLPTAQSEINHAAWCGKCVSMSARLSSI